MNRAQVAILFMCCVLVALLHLFPPWAVSNGTMKFRLGHAWVGSPPRGVGPDDFRDLSVRPDFNDSDVQRMREHVAAGFGQPEIDWLVPRFYSAILLVVACAGVFAGRSSRRHAAA